DDVGWPEPAAVVHLMLSTRSWAPSSDARESKSSIATIQAEKDARSDDSGRPASGERIKWFTFHASIGAIHALTRNDDARLSALATRDALPQPSVCIATGTQRAGNTERASKALLERRLHTGKRVA